MRHALAMSAALLLGLTQAVVAQTNLVNDAVKAQGGVDALRALKTLSIKGETKNYEPGQAKSAGGEPKYVEDTKFTTTWDLAKGTARIEWDRDHKYPDPAGNIKFTETVLPTLGFVTTPQGSQPMSAIRVATQLRELSRTSPTLLLKAVDNPKDVKPVGNQRVG